MTKTSLDRLFVNLKKHLVGDNVTNELASLMDQKYIKIRIMDLCSRSMELEHDKLMEILQLITIALLQKEKDGTTLS